MKIELKKKRKLFMKIYAVIMGILLIAWLWTSIEEGINYFGFGSSILLMIYPLTMIYYQGGIYDDEKIKGPFGWPTIYYKNIISVKYVLGDILIKTEKKNFAINKETTDQESLQKFVNILEKHTSFQLDLQNI